MLSRFEAFVMTPGVSLDLQRLAVQGNDTPLYTYSPTIVLVGQADRLRLYSESAR